MKDELFSVQVPPFWQGSGEQRLCLTQPVVAAGSPEYPGAQRQEAAPATTRQTELSGQLTPAQPSSSHLAPEYPGGQEQVAAPSLT